MQKQTSLEKLRKRRNYGLIIGISALLIVIIIFLTNISLYIERKTIDWRFSLRGPTKLSDNIVIVSIDDESISAINYKWPFPRSLHAKIIDNISQQKPKIIFFDLLFTEPTSGNPAEDESLATAARKVENVIFPSFFSTIKDPRLGYESETIISPIGILSGEMYSPETPSLTPAPLGFAFVNLPFDSDGFVRRAALLKEYTPPTGGPKAICYSSSVPILAASKGIKFEDIKLDNSKIKIADTEIMMDKNNSIPINFRGPPGSFKRISYRQVLDGKSPPDFFKNKIVMIGVTSPSLHDVYHTPFVTTIPMSGVEIQANILEMMLNKDFLYVIPYWYSLIILIVLGIITILITLKFSPFKSLLSIIIILLIYAIITQIAFQYRFILNLTDSSLAIILPFISLVIYRYMTEEKEKRRIRSIFSRYVDKSLVDEIVEKTEEISLGGVRQEVSILFSDIRGFTTFSENLPPEEVVSLLNEYLTEMTKIITKNNGVLDKFVGDAIMAVFGAPLPQENHAFLAAKTALEMQDKVKVISDKWVAEGKSPLKIGIGVHTGEAIIGNIGSELRMEYTAIGDSVNLASRIEGLTKEYDCPILISKQVYDRVKDQVGAEFIAEVKVKGRKEPVKIYKLL